MDCLHLRTLSPLIWNWPHYRTILVQCSEYIYIWVVSRLSIEIFYGHQTFPARISTSRSRLVLNGLLDLNTALLWTKDHLTGVYRNIASGPTLENDAHPR